MLEDKIESHASFCSLWCFAKNWYIEHDWWTDEGREKKKETKVVNRLVLHKLFLYKFEPVEKINYLLKMSFANRRDSYVCKGQLHENRVKFGDIDMMFRMQWAWLIDTYTALKLKAAPMNSSPRPGQFPGEWQSEINRHHLEKNPQEKAALLF